MFNLNYFKYLLNKNKHTFIYLGIVFVALYVYPMYKATVGFISDRNLEPYFIELCVLTIGFTFILPFVNFSHKFNKRAIDLYDALPLTKKEQLTTLLVFQALEVLVPFYVCVILGLIMDSTSQFVGFGCLITSLIVISLNILNTALIFKTNTIFDGVVILGAYHLLPFVLYGSVTLVFESIASIRDSISELINLMKLSPLFDYAIIMENYYDARSINYGLIIIILAYVVVGLISLIHDFKNRKPEAVEGISNNIFAYPLITYAYLFFVSLILSATRASIGSELAITLYLLLITAFITSDFIYNRKIKINLKKIVAAIVVIFISMGVVKFVEVSKSFGYNKIYPKDYEYVSARYSTSVIVKDNESGKEYSAYINLETDDIKNGDSFIKTIQETQDILHDEYFESGKNTYAMFNVEYFNKEYNEQHGYYYSYVDHYRYNTKSETIINFLKDNKNKIHGIYEVYLGDIYKVDENVIDAEYQNYYETFDNYEEFTEKYTIIKIGDVYESYIY